MFLKVFIAKIVEYKTGLNLKFNFTCIIIPYGANFWWGKILTNGHLENFDEKNFEEFHNANAHIY